MMKSHILEVFLFLLHHIGLLTFVPRTVASLTPGAVYLFTMKGPSRKSHSRRKMLNAGPKNNKVFNHGGKRHVKSFPVYV